MTPNRRIFLNIVATYGRSLYALVIGLFCGRWTYLSLGKIDYGLLGVVGGLIGFVTFFNSLMAGSVSRFYAFSVGEAKKRGNAVAGLEECRKWFSIAVMIHMVLPIFLIIVGYPVGEWAVRHYITIPVDRIDACVWVWRFTCVSCFFGMISVPFVAMYGAKQEIAELTIYGFATTTLNVAYGYYMITHPGVWLVKYAGWTCAMAILPGCIMSVRAIILYEECRFKFEYARNWSYMRRLFSYSGSRLVALLSQLVAKNGMCVLVNKCLGPLRNAAMVTGNTMAGHCLTLTGSLLGAFGPAITNAAGEGDLEKMRKLAYSTCRLSTVAAGIFTIPMILEVNEVLVLWLKTPPDGAAILCISTLLCAFLTSLTDGHWMSIFAIGKIAAFNLSESFFWFLSIPVAYLFFAGGFDVEGVGLAMLFVHSGAILIKLYFGRRIAGLSIWYWLKEICLPTTGVFLIALACGSVPRFFLEPSFGRVVLTTLIVEVVFMPLVWLWVLKASERARVLDRLRRVKDKIMMS